MKQRIKSILKYPLIFIAVIAIFIITLVLSSLIPREWIQNSTQETAEIMLKQRNSNFILDMRFDNYTDALMINTAYSINPKKPFESAMLARKNYLPEREQIVHQDQNGELKSSQEADDDILQELYKTVNNDINESYEYARYWHGYLIFLRPALIFLNISEIKVVIGIILVMLSFYLILSLNKRINSKLCYIIVLGLAFSDFFLMGLTLQGVMTFIISIVVSIIICKRFDKIKNIGPYFFITGMLTCFFDLLTHPIVTLGIPLIIYILLKQEKEQISLKESIKIIIINSFLWGIGYILTNLTKWILVDVIYNRNLTKIALIQFFYRSRSQASSSNESMLNNVVMENLKIAGIRPILYIGIIFIYMFVTLIKNYKNLSIDIKSSLPYLIISIMPIAWFILMRNHDMAHAYFTYRGLGVFYIGIGVFAIKLFNNNQNVVEKRNL